MQIIPEPTITIADGWRRSCRIVDEGLEKIQELWWEYPSEVPRADPVDCDSYLLASLLPAMKCGADILVRGSVSRELLANLTELQRVWIKWCPDVYQEVSIEADTIRENDKPVAGAVVAFSGGVDAQFSVYRHGKGVAGYARRPVSTGMFVHGFDIPLDDQEGFAGAAARAKLVLADIGLDLIVVKTNIRELWDVNWEHLCGAALAAAFSGMNNHVGTALIGAGEPYDALITPWGSHPIIDPLMSSGSLRIIHDGAGYNRSEKIKQMSTWDCGVQHLRVCWAGGMNDRNCGKCEKCVRTRLNFLLAGVEHPMCFDSALQRGLLASVVLRSDAARAEWRLIRDEMARTGIGSQLLPDVERVLRRPAIRWGRLLPPGSHRRKWVKRIFGKV